MRAVSRGCRALKVVLWLPALVASTGCATVLAISDTAVLVNTLPSRTPNWVETNRITIGYSPSDVYTALEQEVEKDGRKIVERDAASGVLVVSYPFSLWQNNWGGMIRLSCVADKVGTTLSIQGDGRDVIPHVQAIGEQLLGDLVRALRRRPRTL